MRREAAVPRATSGLVSIRSCRLQPARRRRRRPDACAPSGSSQRSDRPGHRRPSRPHRQAPWRRRNHRVPQRGRRGALRDRGSDRPDRAQRRRAAGAAHRIPRWHSPGRRRRGERRRSHGRRLNIKFVWRSRFGGELKFGNVKMLVGSVSGQRSPDFGYGDSFRLWRKASQPLVLPDQRLRFRARPSRRSHFLGDATHLGNLALERIYSPASVLPARRAPSFERSSGAKLPYYPSRWSCRAQPTKRRQTP